jgi:hypothetical protein
VSSDRQELIRRFAVAIAGARFVNPNDVYPADEHDIWYEAAMLADAEPPADNRIERALQVLREAVQHPGNADGWSEGWEMVNEAIQILESTP